MKIFSVQQLRMLTDQQVTNVLLGPGSSARTSMVSEFAKPDSITSFVRLESSFYLITMSHYHDEVFVRLWVNPQGMQDPEWRLNQLQKAHSLLQPFFALWGLNEEVTPMKLNQRGAAVLLNDFPNWPGLMRMTISLFQHSNPIAPQTERAKRLRERVILNRRKYNLPD